MNANRLFDFLKERYNLKNDAALSRALSISPPNISRMRSGSLKAGDTLILTVHEVTDIPIAEIKRILST